MTDTDVVLLVCAAALVPLAGYFAAIETALLRLSPARIAELQREGRPRADKLATIAADRPRYTNLLLLLRVGAEMLSTVLVAVVLYHAMGIGWLAIAVSTGIMTVVSYVLVGVGPRTIGRQRSYGVALRTAWITLLLGRMFGPLASLLILVGNAITPGHGFREGPFASEVELRELVDIAEQRGVVEHDERQMIHSVFELGDTIVREVMVPRSDVVWIEHDKLARQALALALRSGFSRIPVIGENVDDVVGMVYLKDLVRRTRGDSTLTVDTLTVDQVMRPSTFVPESKPVDELLREMQARRIHMAIVIDEYGGTAGLVTIEDILEEIVGEITDEYDNERPPVEWVEDGTARVTSRLPLDDLGELFGIEIEEEDVDTVGGLLAQALGRVPIPGAQVDTRGLHLVAESAGGRRNRIDSVLVNRLPQPPEQFPATISADDNEEQTVDGAAGQP